MSTAPDARQARCGRRAGALRRVALAFRLRVKAEVSGQAVSRARSTIRAS